MVTLHPNSERIQLHNIDAFALLCQDPRFTNRIKDGKRVADDGDRKAVRKFLGTDIVEFIQYGGGAEAMGCACEILQSKEAIVKALMIAVKTHKIKRGIITTHTECGAIDLAGHMFKSIDEEKKFHGEQLRARRLEILAEYPEIEELLIGYETVDENDEVIIEPISI